MEVLLKADVIGNFMGFPITNTFMTAIIASVVLIILVVVFSKRISIVPSRFQLIVEFMTEGARKYVYEVLDNNKVSKIVFPLILSLFIFILFINLFKFIPGKESIKYLEMYFLKPVHTDLNMTIALAMVSFIVIQFFGIYVLGFWKYGSKFLDLKNLFLSFRKGWKAPFIAFGKLIFGFIELISEISKLISLSFRLFASILVGGILLALVGTMSHYLLPIPVILFEIFVAFLQAILFSVLTLFYIKMAISEPH